MSTATNYVTLLDPETPLEDKLEIIEKSVTKRLSVLLGLRTGAPVPDKFSYIVEEVVSARFSRIGNEGLKQSNQDGLSLIFQDDDFSKFKEEIEEYRVGYKKGPRSGKAFFL